MRVKNIKQKITTGTFLDAIRWMNQGKTVTSETWCKGYMLRAISKLNNGNLDYGYIEGKTFDSKKWSTDITWVHCNAMLRNDWRIVK